MDRYKASLIVLAIFLAGTAVNGRAALREGYLIDLWPPNETMPREIQSITENRDGYLSLASSKVTVRFDGLRFVATTNLSRSTRLRPPPSAPRLADSEGQIW